MQTFNIPDADAQFALLVELASKGEAFIIAQGGKPVAKVVPLVAVDSPPKKKRQLGFMRGEVVIPDNFDRLYEDEIAAMFYGEK